MIENNVSFKNIDIKFTKKWRNICIERFSVRFPDSIINYSTHYYNNVKFEIILNQNINSFNALIDKRKREIKLLNKPNGLNFTIRREEKNLGNYLIAFRPFGNKFSNCIFIEGYYFVNDSIIFYKTNTKDGYLSENKELLDESFEEKYNAIKNIKDNLYYISNEKIFEKGFYIENKAILKIPEEKIQSSYSSVHFKNRYFKGYVRIKVGEKIVKDFKFEKLKLENESIEISKCIVNDYEGTLSKIINKICQNNTTCYSVEYLWRYEKIDENIIIIINLKESLKSLYIYKKNKKEFDKVFNNILASFCKR